MQEYLWDNYNRKFNRMIKEHLLEIFLAKNDRDLILRETYRCSIQF